MASQAIEYIWKIQRPKDEDIAQALMAAAYKTAMETDPNTTQILIRYDLDLSSSGTCGL